MRININKNIILYLLFLIYFKSVFANENLNQFKIEADKSIEYFEKQRIYVASGNVEASKGKFSIKAEKITAFMGKTKSSNMTDLEAKVTLKLLIKIPQHNLILPVIILKKNLLF